MLATEPRIGSRVQRLRRAKRVSQADLAVALGISASYLNLIEHNRRRITRAAADEAGRLFRHRAGRVGGERRVPPRRRPDGAFQRRRVLRERADQPGHTRPRRLQPFGGAGRGAALRPVQDPARDQSPAGRGRGRGRLSPRHRRGLRLHPGERQLFPDAGGRRRARAPRHRLLVGFLRVRAEDLSVQRVRAELALGLAAGRHRPALRRRGARADHRRGAAARDPRCSPSPTSSACSPPPGRSTS